MNGLWCCPGGVGARGAGPRVRLCWGQWETPDVRGSGLRPCVHVLGGPSRRPVQSPGFWPWWAGAGATEEGSHLPRAASVCSSRGDPGLGQAPRGSDWVLPDVSPSLPLGVH